MTHLIALLGLVTPGFQNASDSESLAIALRASLGAIADLTCEFEGTLAYPRESSRERMGLGTDGVLDSYSGLYIWRRDGAAMLDIYHRRAQANHLTRQRIAVLRSEYTEARWSSAGESEEGQVSRYEGGRLAVTASPELLDYRRQVLANLESPKFRVVFEGMESIAGNTCRVVSFVRANSGSGRTLERYWIDMTRGVHLLRAERYGSRDQKLASRLDKVNLHRIRQGDVEVWFPVFGVSSGYAIVGEDGRPDYADEPTTVETLGIMIPSIKINQNLPNSTFTLKFKPGTPINDTLRQIRYEFGQQIEDPPDRATMQAQLQAQIDAAEAQGEEVVAMSWERSWPGWLTWVPWLVATGAAVAVVTILIRQR